MNTAQALTTLLGAVLLAACSAGPAGERRAGAHAATDPAATPLEKMTLARAPGKMSVPIDLHYRLSGVAAKDQATALELAAVPRIAGSAMTVQILESDSVTIDPGSAPQMMLQETDAGGVYRRSLLVTPRLERGAEVRVLVTFDVESAHYAGVYVIPVGEAASSRAGKPGKDRDDVIR